MKFDYKQFILYRRESTFIVLLCTNMHKNQIHNKLYTKSVKEFMAYMESPIMVSWKLYLLWNDKE